MKDKHFKFFIAYTIAGIIGMIICMSGGENNNLLFIASMFLIMAAVVHFKNWKNKQIKALKRK